MLAVDKAVVVGESMNGLAQILLIARISAMTFSTGFTL